MIFKRITALILALLIIVSTMCSCLPFFWIRKKQQEPEIVIPEPVAEPAPAVPTVPEEISHELQALAEQKKFDELLAKDFLEMVTSDTLTMHTYLKSPEKYGITGYEVSWGDLGVYPDMEVVEKDRQAIKELYAIDRDLLTAEQQQSYDVYSYMADIYEETIDTWIMYDPLMGANGYHAIIPLILNEYTFYSARDVDDYLLLLGTFDKLFESLVATERERSKLGLFMSDSSADEIIGLCRSFAKKTDNNVLVDGFNSRLAGLSLDKTVEEEYSKKNLEIVKNVVVPAYKMMADEIEKFKGTGLNKGGLANYDKGKEYYRNELKRIGISKTPEQLIEDCEKATKSLIEDLYGMYRKLMMTKQIDIVDQKITPVMSAEEIMEYLKQQCAGNFPTLPVGVDYSLKVIDKGVGESLSAGFYFTPPIDDFSQNSIYYDDDFLRKDRDYMFFLFAHEGYPGHLLQQVSVLSSSLSDWRKIQSFRAYSEGWAQYAQYYTYRYISKDMSDIARYLQITEELDMLICLRMDLGVNYEGWDLIQVKKYMEDNYPFNFTESNYISYRNMMINNPLHFVPYGAGLLGVRELYERYSTNLGNAFDELKFHSEYLRYGEAPFNLLQAWLDISMYENKQQ